MLSIAGFYVLGNFDLRWPYGGLPYVFLFSYCVTFWLVSIKLYAESHGLSIHVSNAIGLVTFAPVSYLALVSRIISYDALGYAFPVFFVLMFIAPFLRRRATCKQAAQFFNDFWGHIGRTIPIVFLLFMIALAIFFWLYPVFGIPKHRHEFARLSDIILSLLFPIIALAGVPRVQK